MGWQPKMGDKNGRKFLKWFWWQIAKQKSLELLFFFEGIVYLRPQNRSFTGKISSKGFIEKNRNMQGCRKL